MMIQHNGRYTNRQTGRGRRQGAVMAASLTLVLLLALAPSQSRSAFAASAFCDNANADSSDTCYGAFALASENGGVYNSAFGYYALAADTTGIENTAVGWEALRSDTSGGNTAVGGEALNSNTTGFSNTAVGLQTLRFNTEGSHNTAIGDEALSETSGDNDTAVGFVAGNGNSGFNANTTGSNDTFLGSRSGPGTPTQVSNATAVGANAAVNESNALVLGNGATVGIGTSSPDESYLLDVAGGVHATDLTVTNPITGSITGNAGTVTNGLYSTGSYSDPSWLVSLTGSKVSGNISGNAAGFTGSLSGDITGGQGATSVSSLQGYPLSLSTAPVAGQLLMFDGTKWVAGNLPGGSNNYIQNGTSQQAGANFNISGNGVVGNSLQVGTSGTSYGKYLQIPVISNASAPPASDCNTTTFTGRMVIQYNRSGSSTTNQTMLWICSASGRWVAR